MKRTQHAVAALCLLALGAAAPSRARAQLLPIEPGQTVEDTLTGLDPVPTEDRGESIHVRAGDVGGGADLA